MIEFTGEVLVWFWLAVFILSIILEAATVDFIALWFAVAALPSFVLALVGAPLWLQIIAFLIVAIALLAFTRPYMVKYFKTNRTKTNVHSAIGKVAIVTKEITPNNIGSVKLRGMSWSAISNYSIKKNAEVRILDIEGVKLIV
jgi:membrane protein implicated in regulation of membrane protease activity